MSGTRAYKAWHAMHRRCYNPRCADFPRYGGRGITVCERWRSFEAFLADMGEPPPGLTLHRGDNDGPYSPENCSWATVAVQRMHTSRSRIITAGGITAPVTAVARFWDRDPGAVFARLRQGWPPEEAVLTPTARGFGEGHRRRLAAAARLNREQGRRYRANSKARRQGLQEAERIEQVLAA